MKVIFLDFDGVLTTPDSDYVFVPELLQRLGDLLANTDARIVISSSRRGPTLRDTLDNIVDPNNPNVRNVPFPFTGKVIGITPHTLAWYRGQQIEAYLDEHPEIHSYVILDDEDRFTPEQRKRLVLVDGGIGLTDEDIIRATYILNS